MYIKRDIRQNAPTISLPLTEVASSKMFGAKINNQTHMHALNINTRCIEITVVSKYYNKYNNKSKGTL